MGKTRRQKCRKKFRYNVKRDQLKRRQVRKDLPLIDCSVVRESWDRKKHTKANLESMGLVYKVGSKLTSTDDVEMPAQYEVVHKLEQEVSRKRPRALRLPRERVKFIETMMDRHGQDFAAMSRDASNFNQHTPSQLRQMVRRFWSIPQHYASYMKRKGWLEKPQSLLSDD